jgi:hypothetical protein
MQDRLRKEVQEAKGLAKSEGRDELSAEELNSLPYMDAVIVSPVLRQSRADDWLTAQLVFRRERRCASALLCISRSARPGTTMSSR